MSAPIPHTCPILDNISNDTEEAGKLLSELVEDFDYLSIGDIMAKIKEAHRLISPLYGGSRSPIELVRAANAKLREWGEEQEELKEEAEATAETYRDQLNAA